MDTIFALASARGKAGVAVIRISGPSAFSAIGKLCYLPLARGMGLRNIVWDGAVVDQALVLCFAEGFSFTGEQTVELQLHGSAAVISKVMSILAALEGLRPAEAGEFTRRALENGRLDLAQVEGLADLLDSETESQRQQAMRVFSGEVGQKVEMWRRDLIRAAALLEATIDFADEDVPVDVGPEVDALICRVSTDLSAQIMGFGASERIREGYDVAIVGRPNVGKSTLLNAIAQRDVAIVSEVAGTTRDVIEVHLEIEGLAVTLIDTAGLRETEDVVEGLGIQRAIERANRAALRVFLVDEIGETSAVEHKPGDIVVLSKGDMRTQGVDSVSGLSGLGVEALIHQIGRALATMSQTPSLLIRDRHLRAVRLANQRLDAARVGVVGNLAAELVAMELREALSCLDTIIGRVGADDLLGEVFRSFCIGK